MKRVRPPVEIVGKLIDVEGDIVVLEISEIVRIQVPKDIGYRLRKLKNQTIGLLILHDKIKWRIVRDVEKIATIVSQSSRFLLGDA